MRFVVVDSGPQDLSNTMEVSSGVAIPLGKATRTVSDYGYNPLHQNCVCGARALSLELLPPEHAFGNRWSSIRVGFRANSVANTITVVAAANRRVLFPESRQLVNERSGVVST